jgi:serine O-acetyltransferase
MIGRIFAGFFGSIWNVKSICYRNKSNVFTKVAKVIYQIYQYENNSSVAWNAYFAGEPCFPHGMKGIFISGGARVGTGCVIFQQVTIGSVTIPDSKGRGAPNIGNNVYIGAGAKIVGNVRVGDNVRVGANAVVHTDIPDNSVVVVGAQRVINKESPPDNRFYSRRNGRWKYFDNGKWIEVSVPEMENSGSTS